ncbi:AAA family ATPase [candidate division KSB1 bacterium]|nr:AAA family ATPase [candidate division KSB1 bacterium]MBL7095383.1 AAA family ATPase [candidate division KSB1 bacterium]
MSFKIAITGKGGVGKTTIAGLLTLRLIARGNKPVLAVDADPNTCLDAALGVKAEKSVGSVREDARQAAGKGMSSGISKQQLLELKIAESLVEADDFDLIAMGRPEGPGCYCYANNVLKSVLSEITSQYPYVVLDNEAGLENLSRRLVQNVDVLVMVTDPSQKGLETVNRLFVLATEMGIEYNKLAVIINRMRTEKLPKRISEIRKQVSADFLIGLPDDLELANAAENGKSLKLLSNGNNVVKELDEFVGKILGI